MSKLKFNPITLALFRLSANKKVVLGTDRGAIGAVIDDNCTVSIAEYGIYLSVSREGFKMNISFDAAVIEHKDVTFWQCVFNNFSNASKSFEDLGITSAKGTVNSVSWEVDQIVVNATQEDGYYSWETYAPDAFPLYKGYID